LKDFSNSLIKKVDRHSFTLASKTNSKGEASVKFGHAVRMGEGWKVKYGLDL
jgi:hypothetical protein